MLWLIAGLVIFLGTHSLRVLGEGYRRRLIAQWGEMPWKAGYSLLSIAGLALLIYGYGLARQAPVPLYDLPLGLRHASTLLSWFAMVLLVAAYIPGNWFKVKWRHPMVLGVKLWAFAHLLANGNLADVILFGSFLLWAVASFSAARKRDRAAAAEVPGLGHPGSFDQGPGSTQASGIAESSAPMAPSAAREGLEATGSVEGAVAGDISKPSKTILAVVGGTLVWVGFVFDWHASLIGVSPLGR